MKQDFSRGMVLITVILMDILTGMEFDLFVPSFPELQQQFSLSSFWVEALLSVNFTGYCLGVFFAGALADLYGRKPIIVLGLTLFIIGSILCLQEALYYFLLVGRFLQGIGVAAPSILSFLIIADSYPLKKQQSLFAILNGFMNISAGAAPVIGSYITLYFHWQGNFMTLLFLGLTAWGMAVLFIPSYNIAREKESLSGKRHFPLFQSKPLLLLIAFFIFNFVPYWIFVGMSPLLYMNDLGVSLSHFGYYQGALAFIYALGSLLFGVIVNRYDHKKMLFVANCIFIASLISITATSYQNSSNALLITLGFLPFVIGQIVPGTLLFPICLNLIPQAKGWISAILQGGRLIFSAFCLQLTGYFYEGSFQNIGIVIIIFIVLAIMTLWLVIRNYEVMR